MEKNQPQQEERRGPARRELDEIRARLNKGDERFETLEESLRENTAATRQIAENTAGIVRLTTELEAGTRFLCRCALGVRFVLNIFVRLTNEIIKPLWIPALIVTTVIYYITHDHQLPEWFSVLLKALLA